jgi:histidinol-phosphate/aromatic aminotransferase/cobyric acid decarboxylase-like protein
MIQGNGFTSHAVSDGAAARSPLARASDRGAPAGLLRVVIGSATPADRERIYALRHAVYASELGQHRENDQGRLSDALDADNAYIVARSGESVVGFISMTRPGAALSIDKYFARGTLPIFIDDRTYEVRLLTVIARRRGSELAGLLMYAAFRWVEAHGGDLIVGIGRRQVMKLYERSGLRGTGMTTPSGGVTYELMHATVVELRARCDARRPLLDRFEARTEWQLPFPFRRPGGCFHGGAFFESIGERFDDLSRRHQVINADVIDAWFPPAPGVIAALRDELPWLLRTSPPADCRGMVEAIAAARGVDPAHILAGAGSSDLIFRALRHWLTSRSRVLLLDPTYGEYAHVLERVIGCTVHRLALAPDEGFAVDEARLVAALARGYDLAVLVNPNSPTGRHLPRERIEAILRTVPERTRVWIDEAYVEYAGAGESLEHFAAGSEHVIVCKSMSKVYALSGARVAYLCAAPHQLEALRAITPPWVIGLPSQVAAVRALEDPDYYAARYRETSALRDELATALRLAGMESLGGIANFLLCRLPAGAPAAPPFVQACREQGLFIRDAGSMGASLGDRFMRIAVKDGDTNRRMLHIIRTVLAQT